ncbi:MAG: cytochrome c maturation protein CcmE [Gammaproteobacteria bacterium]|jgi:cytochrome c-type biogenesis protein CcmE|nr:cytochrome c maturation protein CcmE [Gammaproteobacteria bacterium]|tara:strand:+ start:1470 stop:1880 length:411 start_codon:yes stop_codon:yes gene_type:complete
MVRKNRLQRIYLILFFLLSLGAITFFVLKALENNIDLYLTPTEVLMKDLKELENFKLGGMVKEDSVKMENGLNVSFIVTDFETEISVLYEGVLPNLFKENSGVVASGFLQENQFIAYEILAKHDENYMPVKIEVQN